MIIFACVGFITVLLIVIVALVMLWEILGSHINTAKRFYRLPETPLGEYRFYRIIGWNSLNFYVSFRWKRGQTND